MIDVEDVTEADAEDEETKVLPMQEWGGYWAEVKLIAQLATQLLIADEHIITPEKAADKAHDIFMAARARVDKEIETSCEDCGDHCDACDGPAKDPVEPS